MNATKLRMIESVLHWVWDPIGVRGIQEALDEYDSYATTVLELLERASSNEEVAAYLGSVESERMGLQQNPDRNADVAALLKRLHPLFAQ